MIKPQDIRDLLHFYEGRLNGAKEVLNWLAAEMAKDETPPPAPKETKEGN